MLAHTALTPHKTTGQTIKVRSGFSRIPPLIALARQDHCGLAEGRSKGESGGGLRGGWGAKLPLVLTLTISEVTNSPRTQGNMLSH